MIFSGFVINFEFRFRSRSIIYAQEVAFHAPVDQIHHYLNIWNWIRIMLFSLIRIRIQLFYPDPEPYHFKEGMYLN
jgi:hypothetical protein